MDRPVGDILREWRANQGLSQLDLALSAGVSARHVSFVETGRAKPSRKMVLRLAETLALPLRERNALLLAAGHAPIYGETTLDAAALEPIRRGLELVLRSHEPFPAFVLDRAWDILLANCAHERMLKLLWPEGIPLPETVNVMQLVLDPAQLRPRIANWWDVAHVLGHRLKRQLRTPGLPKALGTRLEALLALPDVKRAMKVVRTAPDAGIVIPLEIRTGNATLSFFSTIATLGTPQDVTLEELCLESLFPADEETEVATRQLAGRADA